MFPNAGKRKVRVRGVSEKERDRKGEREIGRTREWERTIRRPGMFLYGDLWSHQSDRQTKDTSRGILIKLDSLPKSRGPGQTRQTSPSFKSSSTQLPFLPSPAFCLLCSCSSAAPEAQWPGLVLSRTVFLSRKWLSPHNAGVYGVQQCYHNATVR